MEVIIGYGYGIKFQQAVIKIDDCLNTFNMKHIYFLFFSVIVFSQNKTIQIIDYQNLKPIKNVELIFNNKRIGSTDNLGVFKIKKNIHSILLSKEEYYDTVINLENNIIKLKKIEGFKLNELVITSMFDKSILDSVYKKIKKLDIYKIPDNFHFKNFSKINRDTICYLNEIINFKKGQGFFIEQKDKIINKFIESGNNSICKINNNSIKFNKDYLHINLPYYAVEIQLVTNFQKLFEYKIEKNDSYYKISFKPNRKRNEYPYEGFLIVDVLDFGILEFKFFTSNNTRRNLIYEDKIINFKVVSENGSLINKKNIEGKYEFVQYTFLSKIEILDGFFKGKIFENNCYKESTIETSTTSKLSKKINFSTYNLDQ